MNVRIIGASLGLVKDDNKQKLEVFLTHLKSERFELHSIVGGQGVLTLLHLVAQLLVRSFQLNRITTIDIGVTEEEPFLQLELSEIGHSLRRERLM